MTTLVFTLVVTTDRTLSHYQTHKALADLITAGQAWAQDTCDDPGASREDRDEMDTALSLDITIVDIAKPETQPETQP